MRIACPDCSATYDVPDTMLSSGRKVRCGKCGRQWSPVDASVDAPAHRVAPAPPAAADAVTAPPSRVRPAAEKLADMLVPTTPATAAPPQRFAPEPAERILAPPAAHVAPPARRRRAPPAVWLGWVASVAVWGMVIWAGYAYRAQVMDAWPPSQRLYAALGLGPGS